MTSTAIPDDYSVALFWVPASDSGSGMLHQRLYRTEEFVSSASTYLQDGRTMVIVPTTARLLSELNTTSSSYVDAPSQAGTYYYFVIAKDNSGNEVFLGTLSYAAENVDSNPPSNAGSIYARQAPQSMWLSWTEATDAETSISSYLIFRGTSLWAMDTTEELMSMTPIATLDADARNYSDYSGVTGTLYYYSVVAVDSAGNYASPVVPSNTIQMLEIKVKTVPGSRPVQFTSMVIEITDGEHDVTLSFNSWQFGASGATDSTYSVEVLRDPDNTFVNTYALTDGGLVKIFIDAGEAGLNLHADSSFSMKFIPAIGQPTLEECRIPYLGTYRYIILI
jgi:archaellin